MKPIEHTHTHTFLVLLYCGVKRLFVACDTLWFCIWQLMFISSLIQPSFSQLFTANFPASFPAEFPANFPPSFPEKHTAKNSYMENSQTQKCVEMKVSFFFLQAIESCHKNKKIIRGFVAVLTWYSKRQSIIHVIQLFL